MFHLRALLFQRAPSGPSSCATCVFKCRLLLIKMGQRRFELETGHLSHSFCTGQASLHLFGICHSSVSPRCVWQCDGCDGLCTLWISQSARQLGGQRHPAPAPRQHLHQTVFVQWKDAAMTTFWLHFRSWLVSFQTFFKERQTERVTSLHYCWQFVYMNDNSCHHYEETNKKCLRVSIIVFASITLRCLIFFTACICLIPITHMSLWTVISSSC